MLWQNWQICSGISEFLKKNTVNKMVHFISLQYATYGHVHYIRPQVACQEGVFFSMPDLSERLRILRKEKGLTQHEVGDTLGKSLRAYQYYESGTRRPEYPQLLALADFFDVSLDYLTGRSETRERMP